MDSRDRRLGMDRAISRRDFLGGVSVAIGASLNPACTRTGEPVVEFPSAYYPPAETGMYLVSSRMAHRELVMLRSDVGA